MRKAAEMKDYIKKYWFDYIFALVVTAVVAVLITIKFGYIYSTSDVEKYNQR